jgi:hypothetical protein
VKSILGNFKLVNDLTKKLGVDGVTDLFNKEMPVSDMKKLGLKISSESPDYRMQGGLALGPKRRPVRLDPAVMPTIKTSKVRDKWLAMRHLQT